MIIEGDVEFSGSGLPYVGSPVFRTETGTPYLSRPGVAMVARPHCDIGGIRSFLDGFGDALGFSDYLDDPVKLGDAEQVVKFAGQGCYLSLDGKRTWNKDARKYFDNLKLQGHGSVFEHAVFAIFMWGIDRSVTHEIVRHRAGMSYSQVSQRYVDGTKLRFVMRPEFDTRVLDGDAPSAHVYWANALQASFLQWIDRSAYEYEMRADFLLKARDAGHPMLQGGSNTDARKRVNQSARSCLPNETEAPILVSGNVRSWRHFLEMRASAAADVQIRILAMSVYRLLFSVAPDLFSDYRVIDVPGTGTKCLETDTRKV